MRQKKPRTAWWQEPTVWMVIAGPAIVVVASFVTLWLAIRIADPTLPTEPRTGASQSSSARKQMPAMAGRNHAATPDHDVPVTGKRP